MRSPLSTSKLSRLPLLLLIPATMLPLTQATAAKLPNGVLYQPADVTVQGVVADDKGNPLPGATIVLKGAAGVGVSADADGKFSLSVPDGNATLVISSVGFVTQEVALAGKTTLAIQLVTDNKALDEVVVVGYGTQKRSDLTGAVGSVKAAELTERPIVNVAQGLQGRIAGVDVALNSGQPGGAPTIRVRGYSSISAGNDPLYVVDGVYWRQGITTLNPNDIESIEVLKDASATAIYGAQGSSGVVLVTTKRGRKGSTVAYDSYVSISTLARKQHLLNSREFMATEDLAYQNIQKYDPTGWAAGKWADKDPRLKRQALTAANSAHPLFDDNLNPLYDVDWQKETTQTGVAQSHNLSFSGGSDQLTYGLFLNYVNTQGIIRNTYQKRYQARLTVDNQVKKWLKIGGTIGYSNIEDRLGNRFTGGNNIPRMMIEMIPIVPIQYADGTYGKRQDYPDMESGDNPVAIAREDLELTRNQTISGNFYGTASILPGLDFRTVFGANFSSQSNPYFASNLIQLRGSRNLAGVDSYEGKNVQWQNYLTYNKQLNPDNVLNVVVGIDASRSWSQTVGASTTGLLDNAFSYYNLGVGSTPNPPSSDFQAYQLLSYFARANYTFKDRYLLTVTDRVDGASRFGLNSKYANFPSAAIAWRISQEDFLRDNSTITDLKLRFGYGRTGNSNFGNYSSLDQLGSNQYVFGGTRTSGITTGSLGNPALQWERAGQYDLGLNVGLWQNRISFEADVYQRTTTDLLLDAPIPQSSGYPSIIRNIGSVRNRGLELSLNTANIQGKDFTWSTTFNISFLKNRVLALGDAGDDIFPGPYFLNQTNVLRVGESVGSLYGLVREGTWSTAEADQALKYNKLPGDLKFRDVNNDGQINDADRVILGKNIPTGFGSFINNFRYKGFDLLVDLQFTYGNSDLNLTEHSAQDRTGQANSYARAYYDAWTPDNQNTSIAQVRPSYVSYDTDIDSYKVENASFIRGRNAVLGYNFSPKLLEALKISRLRVYVSAQNFFLITKYTSYDPETSTFLPSGTGGNVSGGSAFAQGIQFFDYPRARTFTAGLNLSF
jgi:TonB-linked SusC/RagA family outer membrane protein